MIADLGCAAGISICPQRRRGQSGYPKRVTSRWLSANSRSRCGNRKRVSRNGRQVPSISTRGRDRCGADDLSCVGSNLAVRGVTPRQHIAGSLTACTALTPEFSEATFPHTRLSQSAALRDRRVLPPRLPCRWLCAGWRRLWACANCSYTARRRSRRRGPRDGHARNFQPSRGRAFSRTLDDIADPRPLLPKLDRI